MGKQRRRANRESAQSQKETKSSRFQPNFGLRKEKAKEEKLKREAQTVFHPTGRKTNKKKKERRKKKENEGVKKEKKK